LRQACPGWFGVVRGHAMAERDGECRGLEFSGAEGAPDGNRSPAAPRNR
jgi:hypothetical protein